MAGGDISNPNTPYKSIIDIVMKSIINSKDENLTKQLITENHCLTIFPEQINLNHLFAHLNRADLLDIALK